MNVKSKTVVVTRALHQAAKLVKQLQAAGANVLLYPCIEIVPNPNVAELCRGQFDWAIFTSQNAVYALSQVQLSDRIKVAAVGPATAKAVEHVFGVQADLVPDKYESEELAKIMPKCAGQKILLPQADIARPHLREQLEKMGAIVKAVVAYRTIKGSGGISILPYLKNKQIDIVTFASPSAVEYFIERVQDEGGTRTDLAGVHVMCIGDVTKRAAKKESVNWIVMNV